MPGPQDPRATTRSLTWETVLSSSSPSGATALETEYPGIAIRYTTCKELESVAGAIFAQPP
eukprot:1585938-Rhodomonas_salina.1